MEKSEFLREAPKYYALAIIRQLEASGGALSGAVIRGAFEVPNPTSQFNLSDDKYPLLGNDILWEKAIEWLCMHDVIAVRRGAFGPPLFSRSPYFFKKIETLQQSEESFANYQLADSIEWLIDALWDIDSELVDIRISIEDYDKLGGDTDEWQPIRIASGDTSVREVTAKLEQAVESIRQDNGYAATFPDERDFVVGGLKQTVEKLKGDTIAPGFLRDALSKLTLVANRFKGAALEAVALGAREAIVEFVKQQGGTLLKALSSVLWGG